MGKQNVRFGVVLLGMALAFPGCGGKFPEMTEVEETAVGEYAAHLLLKYDANYRSRLVDLAEVEAWEEKEQKRLEAQKEKETPQEPTGMDPVADTPIIDNSELTAENTSGDTVSSLDEVWDLPEGIRIIYMGYDTSDSMENEFFSVDAAEGKKLLLLHFQVSNQTASEQMVDLLSQNANIKVTVNGTYTRNTLTTMMTEDLSTYRENIPAGGNADTLLLIEVEQEMADEITAISLKLKNDAKTYTIQLM